MLEYFKIKEETSKPEKDRIPILTKRGLKRKPRRYHLEDEEATRLRTIFKETGRFQNPYKERGISHTIVQSLIELGINKKHKFIEVKTKMKEIMEKIKCKEGNLWESFRDKEPVNKMTGKDINGRIIDGIKQQMRLNGRHPYALSMAQLYACLNIYRDDMGLPLIELCTEFDRLEDVKPVNEL